MESFAIRWSILDGGGFIAGVVLGVGVEGCRGTCFGVGLGAVDLSPSINLFTVSDIFGWAGIDDSARRWLGILANLGAETCGVDGCCCCSIAGRPLEILGKGFLEKGACTFGRLRSRDSAILAGGWLLGGTEACLGLLNGITSFNDGRVGAGFTAGGALTFARVED